MPHTADGAGGQRDARPRIEAEGLASHTAIPALTGLRIVGAAWVVVYHFQDQLIAAWPVLAPLRPVLASGGGAGVALFFILSGFIICHNYGGQRLRTLRANSSYIWRRIARLWPVNVLCQLLVVPFWWLTLTHFHNWGRPREWWLTLRAWLTNAVFAGQIGHNDASFQWNFPAWTLTGEFFVYLLFPILALCLSNRMLARIRSASAWLIAGLVLAYLSGPVVLLALSWPRRMLLLFTAGALLSRAGSPPRWLARSAGIAQFVIPVATLIMCFAHGDRWLGVLMAGWVYSLAYGGGLVARLLSSPPAQIAGQASYALYLLHWNVFATGGLALVQWPWIGHRFMAVYATVCLLVSSVGAYVIWRYFEVPCRRSLNRLFDRAWSREASGTGRHRRNPTKSAVLTSVFTEVEETG